MLSREAQKYTFDNTKKRQKSKFECLHQENPRTDTPPTLLRWKVTVNLSSRTLTPTEEEVLSLGLNYVEVPSRIPVNEIIAATETTAIYLDQSTARHIRTGVAQAFGSSKCLKINLAHKQWTALTTAL